MLGECRAAGDPHVYSFDGAHNDVYGVGKYVFAQSNDKIHDVPDFKIIMETSAYGSASIAERAFLTFKLGEIPGIGKFLNTISSFLNTGHRSIC